MRRILILVCLLFLAAARPALAQQEQQTLVDRSTLAVQEMFAKAGRDDPIRVMRRARGVMVCPELLRAGFIFGGSGGSCVLSGRLPSGAWSYPAFFGIGSGSFGLQIGMQQAEVVMLIMSDRALEAVMDSQFKIGGEANINVVTLGKGIEGATTADLGADILVMVEANGLFAGLTLEGTVMSARVASNQLYYGQALASRQIVLQGSGRNPGAEPLREILARYAGGPANVPVPPPQGGYPQDNYAPQGAAAPRGAVQQQSLPPPGK
jgi:lipid-binding SYLF domain-containing protein